MDEKNGEKSHEEVDEEPAKVSWICGKNGRGPLMKRADALRVERRRRKGRQRLRWENSVKIDLAGVGCEWSMRPRDRRKWGRLAESK